ncbi:Lysophospholipase [Thiomonas arsenitoxydans]|uniref:Lysophospholipase n=2 Tax=Thiomonas arsenitoxydans (strain DSM 22701 / CIP 110005 / 3As) TaxID=426114 RepID=A0ABM9T921_THIA3|nr:arylesterase [Thiomonas arsenitoxydans]CQR45287.1 Lysophospholipase [Thiomonas sp. CB3]CQR36600.1 Lysophospholipase [Thiomonas arsenitoxydans]CQR36618.1 Lysophospholipase [Thiomonas arsenitoxydans]CQR37284.1 Lysophospholipase [Thiomonas arsenitoxydans]CQR38791.1 Lysophospholipase [Thiomonas arsenitoxydans]
MKNGKPLIVESPPPLSRRKVLGLVVSALTAGMGLADAARAAIPPVSTPIATLLVVGDSLSAGYGLETGKGWVDLLRQRLEAKEPRWTVINASISGDTTAGGLARLPALLARDKPRVVIIELGGNDALRGLSLQQTQNNLSRMVALCKKAGAHVLLVGMQIPPNYGPAYTARFAAVFPAVAKSQRVAQVPFLLSGVVGHPDWFQSDNIHPTAQAQPTMLDTVWPYLAPLLALPAARSAP